VGKLLLYQFEIKSQLLTPTQTSATAWLQATHLTQLWACYCSLRTTCFLKKWQEIAFSKKKKNGTGDSLLQTNKKWHFKKKRWSSLNKNNNNKNPKNKWHSKKREIAFSTTICVGSTMF
jgi:hypothetical protein